MSVDRSTLDQQEDDREDGRRYVVARVTDDGKRLRFTEQGAENKWISAARTIALSEAR